MAGYRETMRSCAVYIQEHLDQPLRPRDLAERCGYSYYHFCRIFNAVNGMSPGLYIRRKRLELAAAAIQNGKSVTDAAYDSGFETPSGFTRAFVKEFGFAPQDCRGKGVMNMKAQIKEIEGFRAIGYDFPPDDGKEYKPADAQAGWLGRDFSKVSLDEYKSLIDENRGEIGMLYHPDETNGSLTYFYGPITNADKAVPEGMIDVTFPAAVYAVFETPRVPFYQGAEAFADVVKDTWKKIFDEWDEDNREWQFGHDGFAYEYYFDEKGEHGGDYHAQIRIPVEKR